jgi:hypothetical protein
MVPAFATGALGGTDLSTLLVGYDLNSPGKDYTDLIDKIKTYGAWWHHLDSTWLIKTAKTPTEVRDDLRALQDANDELLVIDVSGDGRAWTGFNESGSAWLKGTY